MVGVWGPGGMIHGTAVQELPPGCSQSVAIKNLPAVMRRERTRERTSSPSVDESLGQLSNGYAICGVAELIRRAPEG